MNEPRYIELDDAVSRIKQAREKRSKDSSPFFFMIGAGISYPSVPLAMNIVDECKRVAQTYERSPEPPTTKGIDLYSHWFQTAYAEPYQRQEYLRELIEGKPITHANFRLAHLLLDHTISNIVVTTNFDDFLSKALTLFGKPHIVCDHPQTVGRINDNQPMLQIVHLHGSYWFYDCVNLRGELEDRAQQSQQTTLTMASLLDMILWDRSPLIIGYSGWEGDVFTEALRRRLARPLRSNAYWFCYRRTDIDSLPDWLKRHPNISFVVPRKTIIDNVSIVETMEHTEAHQGSIAVLEVTGLSKKEAEPLLPADTVFDRLIQAFDLEAPTLTKDPLGFFASQLDNSLPKDSASNSDTDIYAIKRVIERVRKAKQREDEGSAETAIAPSEPQLERVRDALRRADYREAIKQGLQIDLNSLSAKDLDELADAMWSAARGLSDYSEIELSAYELVVLIRQQLAKTPEFQSSAARIQEAKALFNNGVLLGRIKGSKEAIQLYDQIIQRFRDSSDIAFKELVARSLLGKAFRATDQGTEAIAMLDELIERFGEAPELVIKAQVAKAFVNKGYLLGTVNRGEESIKAYDEVLSRFGDASEPILTEQVARASVNKGWRLGLLNRGGEAVASYDMVISRFGDVPELGLKEQVARALVNKGYQLNLLQRTPEALATFDEVVTRFGQASEPALTEQVARALLSKGIVLDSLERTQEALAAWDEVITRYGEAPQPVVQEQVEKARIRATTIRSKPPKTSR